MGKLTDKLFHHDKSTTSSETVSTVPAVVPVPPFEDLAPKETLNTSPSHPSLLQKFKDYIHHDNASTTTPLETPEIVGPAIAVPVIPVTVTSTPVVATPVIVAPVIPTPSSSETVPHHSTLDTLVEKVTHPHPPAGSFIHPFDRPLEVHTIAETHQYVALHFPTIRYWTLIILCSLPEPLPTHTATHVPSAEESPVFSAVPILIVEETIEVAIVPGMQALRTSGQ